MKTKMANNSLISYKTADIKGTKLVILEALRKYGRLSAFEIVDITGLPLQSVTGRINDLRYKFQLIVADGSERNRTKYRLREDGELPDTRQTALVIDKDMLEVLESIDGEIIADNGLLINGKKYYSIDEIFKLI